jgi:hypothetical protein
MVPPEPPIFLLNFNKGVLVERQVIDESGGKNIKNPSEDTNVEISTRSARCVPCITRETAFE